MGALLLFLGLFLKISRWVPLNRQSSAILLLFLCIMDQLVYGICCLKKNRYWNKMISGAFWFWEEYSPLWGLCYSKTTIIFIFTTCIEETCLQQRDQWNTPILIYGDLIAFSRRGNVENQYNLDLKLTKTILKKF